MNVKRSLMTAAAVIAVLSTPTAAAQAAASGDPVVKRGCTTGDAGASGGAVIYNWHDPMSTLNVKLDLADGKADGRYAAIRVLVLGMNGTSKQGAWNKVSGAGKHKEGWVSVKYSGGIKNIGIQVATFKGNHLMGYCTDWGNPD
ncbi:MULTISPECIES: hypothetical protein [unclassified Streptomyces]|uniref:hypothetical protein n=1 Tax=unclassified Streptomyces TaxID=2593676 RepID=UPI00131A3CE7|nr:MULTISPECIES: hypothetical protein [unclassified Streptomyces]MYT30572.1 hypothetical protein [Streptomyces sp. SID8354]